MNLSILLLFLPAATCLFWIMMNICVSRRTSTFWILLILSVVLMLFFVADAIYATPGMSPDVVVYSHLITLFTGPCVLPLIWMYFDRLRNHRRFRPLHFLWVLVPVSLFFAALALTNVIGKESVAAFLTDLYAKGPSVAPDYKGSLVWYYYLWASVSFRVAVGVELIVALAYFLVYLFKRKIRIVHLIGFLRNGETIKVLELQLFNMIIPGLFVLSKVAVFKHVLEAHPWVAIVQSLFVTVGFFVFIFCALYGEKDKITLVQAKHVMLYNYNSAIKGPIIEIMMEELLDEAEQDALLRFREKVGETLQLDALTPGEITAVKEKLFSSVAGSWDDSLLSRFQNLMVNEQLFLQPSVSLQDIADRLHTNKTYISKLVNNTFNLGFPELLNTLRIDYAEQYLLNHRDARQSEVAKACGFLSASSFNNVFKKITGVTPKVWLASNDGGNA